MEREARAGAGLARTAVLGAVVVAAALVVYGGYGHHWSWVGINGRTATLWDWLHLLLLPVAVAVLPLWASRRTRVDRASKGLATGGAAAFALVVVVGYAAPWAWTGFVGNTLWDWLNLIALPLAVVLMPVVLEVRADWTGRHWAALAAGLSVFAAIVAVGYLAPWAWTGFVGNTLWDWLHLLLLPLLLPIVIVPALGSRTMARIELGDEAAAGETGAGDAAADDSRAGDAAVDDSGAGDAAAGDSGAGDAAVAGTATPVADSPAAAQPSAGAPPGAEPPPNR